MKNVVITSIPKSINYVYVRFKEFPHISITHKRMILHLNGKIQQLTIYECFSTLIDWLIIWSVNVYCNWNYN